VLKEDRPRLSVTLLARHGPNTFAGILWSTATVKRLDVAGAPDDSHHGGMGRYPLRPSENYDENTSTGTLRGRTEIAMCSATL
jgi:hypothetical protein